MGTDTPLTFLCIATYRKGDEFLRECRRQGCRVLLLTEEQLRNSDWPRESIDEFYYVRRDMPEVLAIEHQPERLQALGGANQPMLDLMRSRALWLAGNQSEAKRLFSKFLEHRERSSS